MTPRGLARGLLAAALAIALLAVAVLAACSRTSRAAPAGEAQRIVSLGPSTTETIFAIGAGDRLVGRSRYCDYPPEAARVPDVGGIEPDVEAILELRPDLVVGPSGHWSSQLAETLRVRGIASWFPDEIESLAGVDHLIEELGTRTGHAAEAQRVVAALDAREKAVDAAVAGKPRPRVLLVAAHEPVVVVAGPQSFADELLRRAGATNAVTDGGAWPALGFERIAMVDPDVVVDLSVAERGGVTRITPDAHGWSTLRAVRDGRVVAVGDTRVLRPGPRIAEGLAVLARALHPDAAIP
jgi:iron complex transport system substrate-binding protein